VLFCPWALFNGDIPIIILLIAALSDFLTVGFHAQCTFAALPNPWAKIPVDEESAVIKAQTVDVGHAGRLPSRPQAFKHPRVAPGLRP
jgi:hypothetical protein